MNTMRNPTLQPVISKIDAVLKLCGTDVQRDDGQAKGPMYKLGKARLCGLRVRSNHVSLLLFGLAANEPVPSGVTYARTGSHLRVEVHNYDDVLRAAPLLQRTYEAASRRR